MSKSPHGDFGSIPSSPTAAFGEPPEERTARWAAAIAEGRTAFPADAEAEVQAVLAALVARRRRQRFLQIVGRLVACDLAARSPPSLTED